MSNNVIFSKIQNNYIPVQIERIRHQSGKDKLAFVEYHIFDQKKEVGVVQLLDKDYGCYVSYVENEMPKEYTNIGYLADKIEVWDCMERGMDIFEVRSKAIYNSHALHYLRGKRFEGIATPKQIDFLKRKFEALNINSFKYDNIVKFIIDHTPKGSLYDTEFLEMISMYMPQNLIQKYIRELLNNPLIIK